MKSSFLLILLSLSLNAFAALPNSRGVVERTGLIPLDKQTLQAIHHLILQDGKFVTENFPLAYNIVEDYLQRAEKVDYGTLFWFKKAANINEGVGSSSIMIRSYTTAGLRMVNRPVPDLQIVSNRIAINVLSDILKHRGVLPLHNILAQDITAAMKLAKIKDLAGWGGSFFYWDLPLVDVKGSLIKDPVSKQKDDYLTVGDSILRSSNMRNRFIKTCILAMTKVPYIDAAADPEGLYSSLQAIKKLPEIVKTPIIRGIAEKDKIMGHVLYTLAD